MKHPKSTALLIILVLISSRSNAQWEQLPSSPSGYILDIAVSEGVLYLGSFNDGVYISEDSAATWEQINNGLNNQQSRSVSQFLMYGGYIYAATVDGIYRSTNGGDDWTKKSDGITIGPGAIYEFTTSIFEYNSRLFTGAWNGIYKSTDDGESWQITNVSGQGIYPGFFINHYGTLFAARENINFPYGYISTDDGETWEPLTTISVPTITFLSEPNRLWSGTIHGVWLSTDNGVGWIHKINGLPPDPYNSSIIRVNGKLVSSIKFGGSGVFYSGDEGENWIDFGDGLPFLNTIEELIVYGDKIFASTSDGLWQRDTSDIVTGLTDDGNYIPRKSQISYNYPNPFNATTAIHFNQPVTSELSVEVYDLQGRRLEKPYDGILPAGEHSVIWKAGTFSSGIYFYSIRSEYFSESGKMILLK